MADQVAVSVGGTVDHAIELTEHGPQVLDWEDEGVTEDLGIVAEADIVVIASPTYKASFTGPLKSFLDRYGNDGLAGVVTVPVMVGAAPHHAMAG